MTTEVTSENSINFNWPELGSPGNENHIPADHLDRARIAEFLTNYLAAEGKARNYVLNVNAQWGAGKTYFINRWKKTIQNLYPVVYIDAWQQDYSDDPLLTVISSIFEQLEQQHPSPGDPKVRKATKGLLGMFKVATPFIAKAVIQKASGVDTDQLSDELEWKADGTLNGVAGDISGKIVEGLIRDHSTKRDAIQHFKTQIALWLDEITKQGNPCEKPLFVFIDELDRCRPNYAVEMLEVIKHLFDIKGVVFVVATDTEQLQHAVRVVYGAGFDASTYLGRFFNRRITLSCGEIRNYIQNLQSYQLLQSKVIGKEGFWPFSLTEQKLLEQIAVPIETYALDLRTSERIIDTIAAIVIDASKSSVGLNLLFIGILLCMREADHPLFELVITQQLWTESP